MINWLKKLYRAYMLGASHNYYPIRSYGFLGEGKDIPPEDIHCPVCGYYCSGKGGIGCIDKPSLVNPEPPETP